MRGFKQTNVWRREKWVLSPLFCCSERGQALTVVAHTGVEREVEAALETALPDVDLREVRVAGAGGDAMLCVVIDHPDGVTHDLCANVTHVLDAAGLRDRFGIEVSSPGPEPPLRTREHFEESVGDRIALRLVAAPGVKARRMSGTLTSVGDDGLVLQTVDEERTVRFDEIGRARVIERSEG